MVDRKLVLLNDMALHLKPEAVKPHDAARVIVAGNHLVRMTLAELALPGAEMIWTDFRHSASLGTLHAAVQAAGGLDRLVRLPHSCFRTSPVLALLSCLAKAVCWRAPH